jgi:nucleoside-diphosphate-sugar epimerase
MDVSIIGTNGFLSNCIGTFCNTQNYELIVYGRTVPKFHTYSKFVQTDLLSDDLDYDQLAKAQVVIFAAGGGIQFGMKEDVNSIYKLNVSVPITIFNALKDRDFKGKFITFGSYFEIGENIENVSFDEDQIVQSALVAPNDYSISKRTLTRFYSSQSAPYKFYHFILPTIYGETESRNRLIPYTLKSIHDNVSIGLTSGDQVRQYIYIYDAIDIIFRTIEGNLNSGVYNMPGVEEFSVKELVSLLFSLKSRKLPSDMFGKTERADVGMKILRLNASKILKELKYQPTTTVADIYKKYTF